MVDALCALFKCNNNMYYGECRNISRLLMDRMGSYRTDYNV